MSTTANSFDNNSKLDLYELKTLSKESNIHDWEKPRMAANTKRQKKSSITFKERLFGTRKSRKDSSTPTKYDVVRSIDAVDNGRLKEINEDDHIPAQTRYVFGHKLEVHSRTSWCDSCEELIWGLNIQAVRCQCGHPVHSGKVTNNRIQLKYLDKFQCLLAPTQVRRSPCKGNGDDCRYTCHSKCVSDVYLDCPQKPAVPKSSDDISNELFDTLDDVEDKAHMESSNNNLPNFVTSIAELRRLIDKYNSQSNQVMTLHNNYTFDGFIRVQLNLNRPVNINTDVSNLTLKKAVARNKAGRTKVRRPVTEIFPVETSGSTSSSSYDSGVSSPPSSPPLSPIETAVISSIYSRRKANRKLSFYMPKGTYKQLHVTSTTTVKEVIEALLSKYSVTDNPKKYALYEKTRSKNSDDEVEYVYRRLPDEEKPLSLLLSWGATNTTRSFALKEDERGNVEWMNFEVPELDNFLKILQMEEDQLLAQILHKYDQYRLALGNAIEERTLAVLSTR